MTLAARVATASQPIRAKEPGGAGPMGGESGALASVPVCGVVTGPRTEESQPVYYNSHL